MHNPHDKFVKKTLRKREAALSFFQEYLPEKIVSKLDWRTLKITKGSFVTAKFKDKYSDVLYEIRTKGQKKVYIYLLLEHQSSLDKFMGLRFLRYMVEIWELFLEQNPKKEKLPGIIPLLLYHGKKDWEVSVQFEDLFEDSDFIIDYIPKFSYLLKNFSPESVEEIKGNLIVVLFLIALKNVYSKNFREIFYEKMVPLLVELSKQQTGMECLITILRYIAETSDAITIDDIEKKLVPLIEHEKRGGIMTLAETLRKEGEIKGRKEGEIKGEIKLCQELLKDSLPKKLADSLKQKISELTKKLEDLTFPKLQPATV